MLDLINDIMFARLRACFLMPSPFCFIVGLLFFSACTGSLKTPEKSEGFMDHLFSQKGKKVAGTVIYPSGKSTPFKGESIWLEVNAISPTEIRMPIYRDQQVYRTLILGQNEQGLFLQHENKKADGQQAEISLYGGYSAGPASPYIMIFPADAYSRQLLGSLRENVWSLAFNNERSILSYIAEENGHVTMQIDFDLSEGVKSKNYKVESSIDMFKKAVKIASPLALSRQQ
jgi:hypothetical protein